MISTVLEEVRKKLADRRNLDDRIATLDAIIGELFLLRGRLISGEWPLK